jgi:hypothetical protein
MRNLMVKLEYHFVRMVGREMTCEKVAMRDLGRWCAKQGIVPTGAHSSKVTRRELQGHPTFAEFHGPMLDGPGIIRYDDWHVSEILSQ